MTNEHFVMQESNVLYRVDILQHLLMHLPLAIMRLSLYMLRVNNEGMTETGGNEWDLDLLETVFIKRITTMSLPCFTESHFIYLPSTFSSSTSTCTSVKGIKLSVVPILSNHQTIIGFNVFPKLSAEYIIPLSSAYSRISEAVKARRADCSRVQIVLKRDPLFNGIHANLSLPRTVYMAYFGADPPPVRKTLGHPIGVKQILGKFLENPDLAVQLMFRGGSSWFLEESMSRVERDEDRISYTVCNIPILNAMVYKHGSSTEASVALSSSASLRATCGWVCDLWTRIESESDASLVHDDMWLKAAKR
ncbi:hypothetical protein BDR26DRAFT_868213 [Obelidium mucronatum]|nr:hypothetical protein BDR26DRAFT_868213 [Obelidium mucronatum]